MNLILSRSLGYEILARTPTQIRLSSSSGKVVNVNEFGEILRWFGPFMDYPMSDSIVQFLQRVWFFLQSYKTSLLFSFSSLLPISPLPNRLIKWRKKGKFIPYSIPHYQSFLTSFDYILALPLAGIIQTSQKKRPYPE